MVEHSRAWLLGSQPGSSALQRPHATASHPRLVAQPVHPLPSAPLASPPAAVLADSPHRLPSGSGRHVSGPPLRREAPAARQAGTRAARICAAAAGRQPRPPFPPDTTNLNPAQPCQSRLAEGEAKQARAPSPDRPRAAPRRPAAPTIPKGGGRRAAPPARRCTYAHRSRCKPHSHTRPAYPVRSAPIPLLPASSSFLPPPHFVVPSHRPSAPRDTPPYTHTHRQFVCTWRARRFWRLMPHNR